MSKWNISLLFSLLLLLAACDYTPVSPQTSTSPGQPASLDIEHSRPAEVDPAEWFELSIAAASAAMQSDRLSAETLTQYYLERIAQYNPTLNAVITVNPDALEQARQLDVEPQQGQVRGVLHGIPVLLKDNIESREDMATTAGSLALKHNITGRDATITARLREAGAVILGKANLSEWANFRSERSSSGWSGMGGQTRNPYDTGKSPCGSSSGSGVAVAADLALLAVGTETDGSVTCPASVNGIVGIKPTIGLVSRTGIVPISHRQDTAGPMARSVYDAALMLNVMAGFDAADAVTAEGREKQAFDRDYTALMQADALRGKRVGVLRKMGDFHEKVAVLLAQAVNDLQDAGAVIVDDLQYPDNGDAFDNNNYGDSLRYDFKHDLNAYLAGLDKLPDSLDTLEELIEFNRQNADAELQWFQQELFEQSQEMGELTDPQYLQAVAKITQAVRNGIDGLLREHNLDVLIAPTAPAAWSIDRINGDHYIGSGSSGYPAISGYPNITVPMGYVHHLPVGISFIGTAFDEQALLAMAYAYEQSTQHRQPPSL